MVRLDLDLNGILKVTATERATGLAKHVVIDNAMERFRQQKRADAIDRLEVVMGSASSPIELPGNPPNRFRKRITQAAAAEEAVPSGRQAIESAEALSGQARRVLETANAQDALDCAPCSRTRRGDRRGQDEPKVRFILHEVEDLVFYLQDA